MNRKILTSTILLSLISVSIYYFASPQQTSTFTEYAKWKHDFNIEYDSVFEDFYRQGLFMKKKSLIELHNKNKSNSYTRGFNQFSAITPEEFGQIYLTYQKYSPN